MKKSKRPRIYGFARMEWGDWYGQEMLQRVVYLRPGRSRQEAEAELNRELLDL